MKKLLLCLVMATLYLNPLYPVYAETNTSNTTQPPKPVLNSAMKRVEEEKMRLASKSAGLVGKIEDRRDKIASNMATLKDRLASREAALKERLLTFKNKEKATLAEKVNSTLKMINTNRTTMMKAHLEMLSKVLDTIETKVNEAPTGTDVNAAKSAISTARTAISNALTTVDTQSGNDYTIELNSETTVRADAQKARDSLYNNLKTTQELVKQAREAVITALKAAKDALGVSDQPSSSAQP